ncbi:hypothetical protein FHW58_001162 [Duganella sp. 1224]|uniref:DUF5700 domain-containing putative Zn-dependent protease n=1 Tax=Duganella sp. 1224 TaxID=2587052 RepID=UPI0015C78B97|nr:DUF5700 domain-containing putative Zn-dependent protease [Duganella sp. 1224]NYE60010.1 hypothetical protein [Duganella sp. 1224]
MLCSSGARAGQLSFSFDFENARIVSTAISSGNFNLPAGFCDSDDAKALIRKLRLKDCEALISRFKALRDKQQPRAVASALAAELSRPGYGKYAPLAVEVTRQLNEYIPPTFAAQLRVRFIFGSNSAGFAFDDVDDVYVDMMRFGDASTQELAETVAHELFHAVQNHVMPPENLPKAAGAASVTGPLWLNHLLNQLAREGTAELFTHPIIDRAPTPYSALKIAGIERNNRRIGGIRTLFETLGWRMLLVPPENEDAYDNIYGIMFYTDFDETAYDLGWLMASTIIRQDGKGAIFDLLKRPPKEFLLRYQAIASKEGKLPLFSAEFVQQVQALR